MAFWVKFDTGPAGCVEVDPDFKGDKKAEASRLAEEATGRKVVSLDRIPYPAAPRLVKYHHPEYGPCPSFCFRPEQCLGHGSCPGRYACSE